MYLGLGMSYEAEIVITIVITCLYWIHRVLMFELCTMLGNR